MKTGSSRAGRGRAAAWRCSSVQPVPRIDTDSHGRRAGYMVDRAGAIAGVYDLSCFLQPIFLSFIFSRPTLLIPYGTSPPAPPFGDRNDL